MAFDSLARYILVWTTILVGFTAAVELGDDIQNFVPICAQPCLESFIQANFPSSGCASKPTLECLCTAKSSSGYTLGEGALQCISAEVQRGVCNENVTGGSVKHDAYLMCNQTTNSLPNTHSVLTATIADSPTGGSASIILSPTGTETGTVTSILAPTASSTISMAATTNPAAPSSTPAPSPTLNGAQVAGIIVGVTGAILITFIAILVARHFRKRNFPDLEDGLLHTGDDKNKPGTSSSKNTGPMVISAPFSRFSTSNSDPRPYLAPPPSRFPSPTPNPISPSNPFHTPNPSEEYTSLAVTRSQNTTPAGSPEIPARRPRSRLLPAKPSLNIKIPPVRPPPPPEPLSRPRAAVTRMASSRTQRTDRTSIMTTNTAFADIDTEVVEGDQAWQRPSIPENGPQSGNPLYFDDRRGNWVLNKNNSQTQLIQLTEVAELDTYTPMTKSPQEIKEEQAIKMAAAISAASALHMRPQPAFLAQAPNDRPLNRSSSVYSQASAVRRSSRFLGRARNNNKSRKNSTAQLTRSDTMMTHESATTINSCSSSPLDEEIPFDHLSTVAESPRRIPVKHPKMSERLNRTNLHVDLPKVPSFATSPPGQPSPTLKGAALLDEDAGSAYPRPLNTKHSQRSLTSSSSHTHVEADLPRPRIDVGRPLIQSPLSRFSPKPPSVEAPASERLRTPPMQTSGSGFSPNLSNEKFPTPSPLSSRSSNGEGRPHVARAVSPLSFKNKDSAPSGTSALLAKRVGDGKAAALALVPGNKKDRWKMHRDQLTPDTANLSSAKGSLPHTPTWQPKLTPTRHGDDLYLNVQ
ncbi:uncharacterized protein GGS22DRAFT_134273 [Annulohypoxylon maeteangense]|uniref:uncharacterized protein n=1 Tax=Annulohypoxylon maeteangense TaxID=1927788 RepID=UPI002008BE56|nr:uncharacterized protein GGS22DRAFT_134273 [Annulohypoxylon maeteangense]KAI0885766.1 hypothetical protein GGS22DRAFT_134273 [Annulohypoxylon maeteangense]